ncbi:hypothetical protein REPUB_Repub16aG0007700 [Reevesia pubescens]
MESDSLSAVSWVCNKGSRPWKAWRLFANIDHCCDLIGTVDFVYVLREANSFADSLAKLGLLDFFIFHGCL